MSTQSPSESNSTAALRASAKMMRAVGWGLLLGGPVVAFAYPPGFLWGTHPMSPYHPPLSPYFFMLLAMYVAWAILMIRGARDPRANSVIVDYGILANALHGLVMLPQSFLYPHEHQHLVADVPMLFALCIVLWVWHPGRASR